MKIKIVILTIFMLIFTSGIVVAKEQKHAGFTPYYKSYYKGSLGGHWRKRCKFAWHWKLKKKNKRWVWIRIKRKCKKPISCSSPKDS